MKRIWYCVLMIGALTFNSCAYDDSELWDEVHNLDDRLTKVEEILSGLNKEVNSMHSLISELQSRPWITNYKVIEGGVMLTFSDGRTITINDGLTPTIGTNGNWWIGNVDTGIAAAGKDGSTPYIGNNGNWWINGTDTGVQAKAKDGSTPYIVDGYWWIDGENTGVKATGNDGQTPTIGTNGNWWIGNVDTGVKAIGETPYVGENGNWWIGGNDTGTRAEGLTPYIKEGYWWIGSTNTGVKATGNDGATPYVGDNGNWWINGEDTGVKAKAENGETPYIKDGYWWVGDTNTGVKATGNDGATPYIGTNGNWWINGTDTGVKAQGNDGATPTIGSNGNWWINGEDTGIKAQGNDGATPYIGANGNWWINGEDTGIKAQGNDGKDGLTPYIGENGNWWIGDVDTQVSASGSSQTSIIGIEKGEDGLYYWTITINGEKDWIYDDYGNKVSCSGVQPIFRTDYNNYLQYSVNFGITWIYVLDANGNYVTLNSGSGQCTCTQFFSNVYVQDGYLHLILTDGTEIVIKIENNDRGGIPQDPSTPSPGIYDPNTNIPYPGGVILPPDDFGNIIYSMTLSGISDVNGDWLRLYGTDDVNQNIWIDIDGSPKGILVINLEDNVSRVKNDIIFSVDNSGSMSEEADALARDILDLSTYLEDNGLDVRFSVVGYDGRLTGARNFCTASELSSYLNANGTGVNRTFHFGGSDASSLSSAASAYNNGYNECGAAAIQYANANFNFRNGSNRIYINFTDEPNQPNGKSAWSVNFFNSEQNWPAQYGTIHSVYSDTNTQYVQTEGYREYPWRMSEYTGGTKMFTSSSFTGVSLKDIPVMDAITHSYTIKFIIPLSYLDGQPHTVVIKVVTPDGTTRGILTLTNYVFGLYR
ncbi:MAG: PL29 family lyase N-terminal domain-containing protein [Alloprevotella sp.]